MTILSFLLMLFPIVIVHEFGHFLVGKYLGANPTEFSIGFGRQLYGFKWLGANFKIGWIPLGGYVKFEKVQFDIEQISGQAPQKIAPWKWFFISIAGSCMNFVFTFVIFAAVLYGTFSGMLGGTVTSSTLESLPVGSKLVQVEDSLLAPVIKKAFFGSTTNAKEFLVVNNESNKEFHPLTLTPEDKEQVVIDYKPMMPSIERIGHSLQLSGMMVALYFKGTLTAFVNLVTPTGYREIMGPVGIAGQAEKARAEGLGMFLFMMASFSFAVGFFQLIPLTFLDGGRALLALSEQIFKKPISMVLLGKLNILGFIFILTILVLGTASDILRLMGK